MSDMLKDNDLSSVNGGAGLTSYGYPIDNKGNVTFTDKTGQSIVLSSAQWNNLLNNYRHTGGNPEAYVKDVTIAELREALLLP
ncbi:MAG: hypothetical protein K5931_00320 [Lachnospiraceae bacterium]|nr:hypothetical protein [Lachnospiraceae bacterium]